MESVRDPFKKDKRQHNVRTLKQPCKICHSNTTMDNHDGMQSGKVLEKLFTLWKSFFYLNFCGAWRRYVKYCCCSFLTRKPEGAFIWYLEFTNLHVPPCEMKVTILLVTRCNSDDFIVYATHSQP